jgi:acetylornithine deacetylase
VISRIEGMREEIVCFLQELISYPSVSGNEKPIQEFIARALGQLGLRTDIWEPNLAELQGHPGYVPVDTGYVGRPNVVGLLPGTGGGRSLLLNGHVDVIPAGTAEAWSHNPWAGEIVAGKLYGRGASDMKSGLAAMTMAVAALVRSGVRVKGDVIVEYVVDEELSGNGTLACILRGYAADAGVCCETSSMRVQPASIGRIWFEIRLRGKPAGVQRRAEGISAIEKGYEIVSAVSEFEQIRMRSLAHPLYPDVTSALPCSVGVFEAGSYPSAFPDTCLLRGSLATLPGEDSAQVKESFARHVLRAAAADPWLSRNPPEVLFKGYFAEPSELTTDHAIVRELITQCERVLGRRPAVSGREGAADIRFLNSYGHTPTVIFGPGLTEQMHATDEWVYVDDLIAATKVIALAMLNWCRPAE